jgi:hypothetical protein
MRIARPLVVAALVVAACAGRTAAPDASASRLVDRRGDRAVDAKAPERSVTVEVVDEQGAPVEGAQVVVVAGWSYVFETPFGGHGSVGEDGVASGTSDAQGRFAASPRLSRDVKCLSAAAILGGRAGAAARQFPKDADDGGDWLRLRVVLRPGLVYSGRVVDSAGRPVPDAKVQCHFGGGDFDLECAVAADGSFACGPVPVGAERVWMSARHDGPVRQVWSEGETHPSADRPITFVVDPVADVPENRK